MFEAKFVCGQIMGVANGVEKGENKPGYLATLKPIENDDDNIKAWGGTVPNGGLQLGNLPPEIAQNITLGQQYKVTIEPI